MEYLRYGAISGCGLIGAAFLLIQVLF